MFAGQISLKIGFAVALIATLTGTLFGSLAGFFGRWVDQLLMRLTDLFLVVPAIAILAIAIRKFGNKDFTIVLVLASLGWMYIARVVRGQVLSIKEKEYVDAARASGASSLRIIVRHVLPNTIGPILVNATLGIAAAIVIESTLSFLGFGVQPPTTSWGRMLNDARGTVGTPKAHLIYFPGLALLITVLAVNYIGDGLRDAFDPESRR
jgi:peptide/nickel transport system permease protein